MFGAMLAATPAAAGNISLSLTVAPQVSEGTLTAQLTVRNVGDDSARAVSPVLQFRDGTVRAEARPVLAPGATLESTLTLPAGDLATGRWPYRVAIDYADANEYPFQALHAGTVVVGAPPPAKLAVLDVSAPELSTSGSLGLRLKNLGGTARTVTVGVHLPEGIELADPVPPVELAAWEEQSLKASLVNRTALPGSRYGIFVSAEYDEDQVHQAVVVAATLEIVAAQSLFERWRTVLWIAAGLLVLAWVGAIGWHIAVRRRAPSRG